MSATDTPLPPASAAYAGHPLTASAVRTVYRIKAPVYDAVFGLCFEPGRRSAVAALHSAPGDRILEVGVGTGLALRHWHPAAHITGIDLSPHMLARAEHTCRRRRWRHVELRVMDAQATTFADNAFDKIAAMYVVSAAPDPAALLREMRRVCRPGGRIVIVNHFAHRHRLLQIVERGLSAYAGFLGFNSALPLEQITGSPGLRIVRVQRANWAGYWTLVEAENVK